MKLTYINENNLSVILTYSYPFFLQSIEGEDGLKNEIFSSHSAYEDGANVINTKINERYISLTGIIKGQTNDDMLNRRMELLKVFNPKFKGTLIYENGNIKRTIECYVEDSPKFTERNVRTQQNFIISLNCPNPYWRNILESKINIALWKGMFKFPLIIPQNIGIIMGLREPSLIVNVLNTGDVESGMIIKFKALGTLKNPSILNVETQEFFKVNKSMVAGEIITVNTNVGNKKVIKDLNGIETNILNLIDLDSTFLQLNVGDNLFRYNADENLNNLEISIYYNPYYLGV